MDYYKLKVLNHRRLVTGIIILLLLMGMGGYFWYYENHDEVEVLKDVDNNVDSDITIPIIDNADIYVDIKGYVAKPGVYAFKKKDNARVNDLIIKAGGLKKDADTTVINLSKKLEDEMTIIIYSKSEINNYVQTKNDLQSKLEICEQKIQNNACLKEEIDSSNEKININTSSLEELMTLSGIGESKAKAIIEYRKKKNFTSIEEIKNVEGIGDSLFENIKENIRV